MVSEIGGKKEDFVKNFLSERLKHFQGTGDTLTTCLFIHSFHHVAIAFRH